MAPTIYLIFLSVVHGVQNVLAFEMQLNYTSAAKGWMNTTLFGNRFHKFDNYVGLTPDKRILLFIDNASVHSRLEILPSFAIIHVEFLPKRTTSILRPLDLGVIDSLKNVTKERWQNVLLILLKTVTSICFTM